MIRKPTDALPPKKLAIVVYGLPSQGKTTLALSAPKPLHIDTDKGIDRINPIHRAQYIQPETYQEILDDLKGDLSDFETIVIDTGGTLFDYMADWVLKRNPKAGRGNGELGLRGFGEVASEFKRFTDMIRRTLNKHIVIIFHAKEDKNDDRSTWRPDIQGSTKNEIWKPIDLGGFMQSSGGKRTISFNAMNDGYLAKGNRTVNDVREIPELVRGRANDFLTVIFKQLEEAEAEYTAELEKYHTVMDRVKGILEQVEDVDTANAARESIKNLEHVFSSKDEAGKLFQDVAKAKGLRFDKIADKFVGA